MCACVDIQHNEIRRGNELLKVWWAAASPAPQSRRPRLYMHACSASCGVRRSVVIDVIIEIVVIIHTKWTKKKKKKERKKRKRKRNKKTE